jgi:hypothetical protein
LSFVQVVKEKKGLHNGAQNYTSNENHADLTASAALGKFSFTHRAHFFTSNEKRVEARVVLCALRELGGGFCL